MSTNDFSGSSLQVESKKQICLNYVPKSNWFEILVEFVLSNDAEDVITVKKITWDLWLDSNHLKNGVWSKVAVLKAKDSNISIIHREILMESEISNFQALWIDKDLTHEGYVDGLIHAEYKTNPVQKNFSLFGLKLILNQESKQYFKISTVNAEMDRLTGIPYKNFLEESLQNMVGQAGPQTPLSVAIIDIDFFEDVNNRYSHAAGDDVLITIASLITSTVGRYGSVVRYSGHTFAVAFQNIAEKEAETFCEDIRTRVEKLGFKGKGLLFSVTVSIGISTIKSPAPYTRLLQEAEEMLNLSQLRGRNKVSFNIRTE